MRGIVINDEGVMVRIWEEETMQNIPKYITNFGLSESDNRELLKGF